MFLHCFSYYIGGSFKYGRYAFAMGFSFGSVTVLDFLDLSARLICCQNIRFGVVSVFKNTFLVSDSRCVLFFVIV